MATRNAVVKNALKGKTVTWSGLNTGDDGNAINTEGYRMTAQGIGTFASSTITMQGSNDGTNWTTLNDQSVPANPCSFTAAGLKGVLQAPKYIRPLVSGGTATGLEVVLFMAFDSLI